MKLGIVVVYLFNDARNEALLDLHLSRIEKHTTVPYVIYGGVNRLARKFRLRLAQRARVRMCELPETELRGGDEHAYYLDHLVRIAAEDGASHIVSLHLDSFPVRSGWAEELAGKLSENCALATIERIDTACLFFSRDFFLEYRPTFRLSKAERDSPEYRRYIKRHRPMQHSGIGYGFKAYSKGLSWYYMKRNAGDSDLAARLYDGMIFHIGKAVYFTDEPVTRRGLLGSPAYRRLMNAGASIYRAALPESLRWTLRTRLEAPIRHFVDRPRAVHIAYTKERLVKDTEAFLNVLMEKKPPEGVRGRSANK